MKRETTIYNKFRGVDYSMDPSLVAEYRSPYAPNLISDTGGRPEKRPGWRTLHRFDGAVNGLFRCEIGGEEHRIAHVGSCLYRWTESESSLLMGGAHDARSGSSTAPAGREVGAARGGGGSTTGGAFPSSWAGSCTC